MPSLNDKAQFFRAGQSIHRVLDQNHGNVNHAIDQLLSQPLPAPAAPAPAPAAPALSASGGDGGGSTDANDEGGEKGEEAKKND